MVQEKYINPNEFKREISITPPAIESFLNPIVAAENWPQAIASDKSFQEQIQSRKELNDNLNDILDHLPQPDTSLEVAISQGHITEAQAEKLYKSLNNLLENEKDYKRIVLYLPFEILPSETWHPADKYLQVTLDRFKKAYMKNWKDLLVIHDVRANFVDGDVIEIEQRDDDLSRVVKAAHLVPILIEKGLLNIKDVISLVEKSNDSVLRDSIADTLPVLSDLGFITEKEIKLMQESNDRLVSNMAVIILSSAKTNTVPVEPTLKTISLATVQGEFKKQFSHVDSKDYGNVAKKRESWLKDIGKQTAIKKIGNDIGAAIIENSLSDEIIAQFLSSEADIADQQALVEGILAAIEANAATDINKAQSLYKKHKEALLLIWKNNNPETQDVLTKTFYHLNKLNIVDDNQLADLNIVIPKLVGPLSENFKPMEDKLQEIREMITAIESNQELSELVYPLALVYGSRLKGYGLQNSDIDLATFIKPGASPDDHEKIQEMLKKIFPPEKIQGEVVQFWLEEKEGHLEIRNFDNQSVSLGESYWAHILFGAAWEGNKNIIKELHEKLLVPYLYETNKVIHGRNARDLYLEEIEKDTLQYRLMHKGYERIHPSHGGIHTTHADEIDGNSMFWDSGYRQVATKLFVSKVFIPKLPQL